MGCGQSASTKFQPESKRAKLIDEDAPAQVRSTGPMKDAPVQQQQQQQQEQQQQKQQEPVDDGEIFEDPDFPAIVDSITTDRNNEDYERFKKALWRRPHEIMGCGYDEIKVFDSIAIDDIKQGFLGNCYFLAALSGLAEVPGRVKGVFRTTSVNKNGRYTVRFLKRGIPTLVTIDDRFPCSHLEPHNPLFSKPNGKELWSILLEKAWAKLYKGYINVEAGFMEDALEHLTGAPSFRFSIKKDESEEDTWKRIKHADSAGYIIGGSSESDAEIEKESGIVGGHAYTIVSAHEVEGHKLLRLRNPWGRGEWKGDFSDSSPLWTESLKKAVDYEDADNGIFYMTVQDFRTHYTDYSIHVYNKNWLCCYIEQKSAPNHAEYFKFSVEKPCEAYFRIHQEHERSQPEEVKKNFKYSPANFMIVKVEKDGGYKLLFDSDDETHPSLIHGRSSLYMTKDGKVQIKEAGDYIIRAKVYWRHGKEDTFTLSAYSPVEIAMKSIPSVKGFLTKYLTVVAEKQEEEPLGRSRSFAKSGMYLSYSYIMVKNNGVENLTFKVMYDMLKNRKLSKLHKESNSQFTMVIAPGSSKLVYTKEIDISAASNAETRWKWI